MEGTLQLKETDSGWRHYILLNNGGHYDLHCGNSLEVQLGEWIPDDEGERFQANNWLPGRYEANLSYDKPKAHLYIGYAAPFGQGLYIVLPMGVKVRIPER
ncbi:hypothetical protein SAMN05660649_04912 [Desulfotomaculum arcticum]|uniref:DUF5348 domain-containing protein n=1 Tax=Desulfotruncus arcticus DSM 17038 TaxID=1121424 RepID=A0A1I2ZFC2_9FIRM|nr:hypothetical protein [Desulfotruncus arcticus]SFH36424.1 hypothetical protein SAMN05660649_04912 [Desulfotomaculum arcticum] [Desulfotruncus arcticus DSM 17038]